MSLLEILSESPEFGLGNSDPRNRSSFFPDYWKASMSSRLGISVGAVFVVGPCELLGFSMRNKPISQMQAKHLQME